VALLLALAIGYVLAVYHSVISRRMQELYDSSIHDSLTGMLNRHVIKKAVEHHIGRDVARRYRQSEDDQRHARSLHRRCGCCARFRGLSPDLREGDQCARLGDFAPDCDNEGAGEIAGAVLGQLSEGMPLVGAPFSVSIGIALHDGAGADFAGMHREADTALHQAKAEGRNRVAVFDPSTAVLHADPSPKVLV
jgi:GGDEF domain-containing protein